MRNKKKILEIPIRTVKSSYTVTKDEIKQFYLRFHLPTVLIWSAVTIAAAVATSFVWYAAIAFVVALGSFGYYLYRVIRSYKLAISDKALCTAAFAQMTQEEAKFSTEIQEEICVPWRSFVRIVSTPTMYAFRAQSKKTVLIPRRVFSGEEQRWIDEQVRPAVNGRKLRTENQKNS